MNGSKPAKKHGATQMGNERRMKETMRKLFWFIIVPILIGIAEYIGGHDWVLERGAWNGVSFTGYMFYIAFVWYCITPGI